MNGKDICKELKSIRRSIAKENHITMDIPDCHFKGACLGTCPRCEEELQHLENELAKRISIGKIATVAGISLTLATGANAAACNIADSNPKSECGVAMNMFNSVVDAHLSDTDSSYAFCFLIKDKKNSEIIPFANVVVYKNGEKIAGGQSDLDGLVLVKGLKEEEYDVEVKYIGYSSFKIEHVKPKRFVDEGFEPQLVLNLTPTPTAITLGLPVVIQVDDTLFKPGEGHIKVDGVKVKANY